MAKHVLLVEGENDKHVIGHLLKRHGISAFLAKGSKLSASPAADISTDAMVIIPKDNIGKLLKDMPTELRQPGLERLGIVVDADTDVGRGWRSVKETLHRQGAVRLPEMSHPADTIYTFDGAAQIVKVGVWAMPDNNSEGNLETFFTSLVQNKDSAYWNRAVNCVNGIPPDERRFKEQLGKAYVRTWLAWQSSPGAPMDEMLKSDYVDVAVPCAQSFVHWIRRLFDLQEQP